MPLSAENHVKLLLFTAHCFALRINYCHMLDPVTPINNSWYVSLWCFPAGSKKRGFQRKNMSYKELAIWVSITKILLELEHILPGPEVSPSWWKWGRAKDSEKLNLHGRNALKPIKSWLVWN